MAVAVAAGPGMEAGSSYRGMEEAGDHGSNLLPEVEGPNQEAE